MKKSRINHLIGLANEAIRQSGLILQGGTIKSAYNGHVAALPVAIALSGLKPAIAIYYQDKSGNSPERVDKSVLLEVIGKMIRADKPSLNITNSETLVKAVLSSGTDLEKALKREIIDCAIALKLVIRTYKLSD